MVKWPSFVKEGYSLEPRASSGRLSLHLLASLTIILKSQPRHIGVQVWVYVCRYKCTVRTCLSRAQHSDAVSQPAGHTLFVKRNNLPTHCLSGWSDH